MSVLATNGAACLAKTAGLGPNWGGIFADLSILAGAAKVVVSQMEDTTWLTTQQSNRQADGVRGYGSRRPSLSPCCFTVYLRAAVQALPIPRRLARHLPLMRPQRSANKTQTLTVTRCGGCSDASAIFAWAVHALCTRGVHRSHPILKASLC